MLAGLSVLAHRKLKLSDELFRKLPHLAAVFAIIPIVLPISSRIVSFVLRHVFAAEAYLGIKLSGLKQDLDMRERSDGERQRSMLLLFTTYALIIALCWGFFGQKWMVILSVVSWGVGDAFAALIGKRTLLLSILMSSTGPLVLGVSALMGQSSTQIADLVRRTAEFVAILISFFVYRTVHNGADGVVDEARKEKLEMRANWCVGVAMVVSGVLMAAVALLTPSEQAGNVILGVLIAAQGVVVNGLFWRKYAKLSAQQNDAILSSQCKLYRAKTFVDLCVFVAVTCVFIAPDAPWTPVVDKVGTLAVAFYLAYSGLQTIPRKQQEVPATIGQEQ